LHWFNHDFYLDFGCGANWLQTGPPNFAKQNLARSRQKPFGFWRIRQQVDYEKRMSLQDKAEAALKKAVRGVVKRHKKTGRRLEIWENGKTIRISPNAVK